MDNSSLRTLGSSFSIYHVAVGWARDCGERLKLCSVSHLAGQQAGRPLSLRGLGLECKSWFYCCSKKES
jgi:hypothetical protein